MRRIGLAVILAVSLTLAPLAAGAQQPGKVYRVGVLMNLYSPDAHPPQALRQRLRDLGYVEGQNLVIDWRYQLGGGDRLPTLAAELVRLKPDVIVADVTVAIRAAIQATSTIPIVMAISADAVGSGLVTNLGRPGGNVTGVTIMLAVLWNPANPLHRALLKEIEAAAPSLRLQPIVVAVRSRDENGRGQHCPPATEVTERRSMLPQGGHPWEGARNPGATRHGVYGYC